MKFRKKPIIIEATQWFKNGDHPKDDNFGECADGIDRPKFEGKIVRYYRHPDVKGDKRCANCGNTMHYHGWIDTLEGGHIVCPSDYIITGIAGEMYPCKEDIFNKTYEKVEE